jgi:hypothetical protein
MPDNLVVRQGTTTTLEDNPKGGLLEGAHQTVHVETFADLVKEGIISSNAVLEHLLEGVKKSTEEAITSRDTFAPFVAVRGTSLPDLRRFGSFTAATPQANPSERSAFWRFARGVSPSAVSDLKATTNLSTVTPGRFDHLGVISKFHFADVTVESNAVLQVTGKVQVMLAGDVFIKKGGKIVVSGDGFHLKASSIHGEQ